MYFCQITSGNGPIECEEAVYKFLGYLGGQCEDLEVVSQRPGSEDGTLKSVFFKTQADLSRYEGTICWTCPSRFRAGHKRKNWFISFRTFSERELPEFSEDDVIFQTTRSGGHGGQNVNKVETAVRAIHKSSRYATVCQDERSQAQNKKRALERIKLHFLEQREQAEAADKKEKWSQHNRISRGNPVASFTGEKFKPL